MKELFARFFGGGRRRDPGSKEEAKQRLKFLLIHDQVDLSPAQLDAMKEEILAVIAKYVEIDTESTEFKLEKEEDCIALVSSIPVRRVVERPAVAPKVDTAPAPA